MTRRDEKSGDRFILSRRKNAVHPKPIPPTPLPSKVGPGYLCRWQDSPGSLGYCDSIFKFYNVIIPKSNKLASNKYRISSNKRPSSIKRPHPPRNMLQWEKQMMNQLYFYRIATFPLLTTVDQFQISPASSPETLHHSMKNSWLSIAYSVERWL